ncbi:uncharacterized protein [Macrobrachium rosenbergii]|uniref:uncharacterized protein n=1 Tax=Macrobrachium rosenbergii TaxID=79674 RepID=UPI0034D4167F
MRYTDGASPLRGKERLWPQRIVNTGCSPGHPHPPNSRPSSSHPSGSPNRELTPSTPIPNPDKGNGTPLPQQAMGSPLPPTDNGTPFPQQAMGPPSPTDNGILLPNRQWDPLPQQAMGPLPQQAIRTPFPTGSTGILGS